MGTDQSGAGTTKPGAASLAGVVSLEEYLRTSYEPDAEYVDGWIEERPMGERDHSALQRQLLLLLSSKECLATFQCFPELRVQTLASHFRVPDLCLVGVDTPWERFVRTPPMLCIEVLSPEDTMSKTLVKVREYLAMGVPEVWVLDPESQTVEVCRGVSIVPQADGLLTVPGTSINLALADIFGVLGSR